jgi:lysophospholipase L1-like esterase
MRRVRKAAIFVVSGAVLAGCVLASGPAVAPSAPPVAGEPVVYVAIGASETAGVGTQDPFTQAWPKVLWRESLPEAVLYDLGRPGSTLEEALVEQAGEALALSPDVVTVWLNVNDVIAERPVAVYEAELAQLVEPLTSSGATVLVATTPRIDALPIYVACRPDPPTEAPPCPQAGVALPTPAEVRRIVDGYNAAITRVAGNTGAVVVDLQAFGDAPVTDPQWIADDGFHPSAEGAEAIAAAFGDALPDEVLELAAAPR